MNPEAKQQIAVERMTELLTATDLSRWEQIRLESFDRQINQCGAVLSRQQRRMITVAWNKRNKT